jgi:hypothetical protein
MRIGVLHSIFEGCPPPLKPPPSNKTPHGSLCMAHAPSLRPAVPPVSTQSSPSRHRGRVPRRGPGPAGPRIALGPKCCNRSINSQRLGLITENNCAGELKVKTAAAGFPVFHDFLKRVPACSRTASSLLKIPMMASVILCSPLANGGRKIVNQSVHVHKPTTALSAVQVAGITL